MFDGIKAAVRGWLGTNAVPTDTKAPRSSSLTSYMNATPGVLVPQWSDADTVRHHTGWVYASVRAIANRVAGQGVRVGRRTPVRPNKGVKSAADGPPWLRPGAVKELASHPLLDALDDPNPYCTAFDLIALSVASILLTGVGYLWLDEQPDGSLRIWYLPAGWVRSDPDEEIPLTRFIVRPIQSVEEFPLDASELIRFALPDPANPLAGLGVLRAGSLAVQTDTEIQTAQLVAFRNRARPGMVVTVNQQADAGGLPGARPRLTDSQRRSLQAMIRDAYAGAMRHGEPLILDALIEDIKFLFDGQGEMDFRDSSAVTKERITQLFGTNPIILGQVEGANRASAVVADENFCYATCKPLAVKLGQTLTKWMRAHHDDPDLVVWVPPPEPRDPDGRRADLDQLIRAGAIRVNELRAEHGLPPDPDGDELVKAPASSSALPSGQTPPPPDDKQTDTGLTRSGGGDVEPGWARGHDLWKLLTPEEKCNVFQRHKGGKNGMKRLRE